MKISATYGIGFDPYKDYTAALKRSVDIKSNMPDSLRQTAGRSDAPSTLNAVGRADKAEPSEEEYKVPDLDMKSIISQEMDDLEDKVPARNDEKVDKIAESLKGLQDFDLIGRDASIDKLDTMQAVSDMRKDSILQEYQFFVGNIEAYGKAEL